MSEEPRRENFIPFRRGRVVELITGDPSLDAPTARKLESFCGLVTALYHHELHQRLERLSDAFHPFDPDTDTRRVEHDEADTTKRLGTLFAEFEEILVRANYEKLTEEDLDVALAERSLIPFELQIDFDDFENVLLYRRGRRVLTVGRKRGVPPFRKEVPLEVETFERVVLLLRYRGAEHFRARGRDPEKLPFRPGKLYVQLFKSIPRADLELLFPNVKVGMTRRHKALFLVPAVGAGIPVLLKVVFSAAALVTALAIFLGLREGGDAAALAGATAGVTALAALGGYLFRQYAKWRSTLTRFLKGVTEQLFFKNIDSNSGVFRTIIDAAEREETKEAVLAYHHLLAGGPATPGELDARIESWFETRLDTRLDFEVDDALGKLERLGVVDLADDGRYRAKPVDAALRILDETWDRIYSFE